MRRLKNRFVFDARLNPEDRPLYSQREAWIEKPIAFSARPAS